MTSSNSIAWTPELIRRVRHLAMVDGKSASEIARILGEGFTKNKIVGLAYRVRPRIMLSQRRPRPRPVPKIAAKPATRLSFVIVEEVYDHVLHADLHANDRRCRFPLWPDGARPKQNEMLYCGEKTKPGSAWCEAHRAIVYRPAPEAIKDGRPTKSNRD